ncbi:MAG TPA: PTS sugar transporter subunit IIA, partial [Ignavibacteria bacterium]|nr:PTS sugar transporter subunit IIA [Ignavibacteria bacterium]
MKICEILTTSRIKVEITSTEKEKVIEELIDLFVDDPGIKDINEVKKSILSREKIMSTGVGKGFAIPHAKSDAVKGIVAAFGKSSHPIEYNALDGEPVNLIFVLVGQQ